ncbi:matrixin family metalloprotease [Spirosoma validum]|uniref:Matrixin family metalloprotease n=1 Tax=Spirosoma validum TaxID=2771355 RepID=A0A927GBX4_9BACT|nr:matrixin family metalloprotease [Spirosoma validum]MBD2751856.1 matrixin family metalloprotease [Spirosoma validum]
MRKLSTQVSIPVIISLISLFWQCQDVAPLATQQTYLSTDQNTGSQRLSSECAIRYKIANTFTQLDNSSQLEAIRAGFAVWEKTSKNLSFLEFSAPDRAILFVRFVNPEEIQTKPVMVTTGLLPGEAAVTSALRSSGNGTYTILLSNGFNWNTNTLTRAVAYHAGLLLGVSTSDDMNSLMSPVLQNQIARASKADSIAVNRLYVSPCAGYLPIALQVSGPVTKTIKFDKQGTVLVTASGQINVGNFVGVSPPEGKTEGGVLGLSLADYSIVPTMFHAALMYKLNDEANWRYCGKECSFSTGPTQSVNLTFGVNDNNLTDNTGAYDVKVQYK